MDDSSRVRRRFFAMALLFNSLFILLNLVLPTEFAATVAGASLVLLYLKRRPLVEIIGSRPGIFIVLLPARIFARRRDP
jgi:hypothetical protein